LTQTNIVTSDAQRTGLDEAAIKATSKNGVCFKCICRGFPARSQQRAEGVLLEPHTVRFNLNKHFFRELRYTLKEKEGLT
jgi:hypothetical protein